MTEQTACPQVDSPRRSGLQPFYFVGQ